MSYYMESLLSIIRREIERTMGKLHKMPRMGLVSSYDKVNHAVKVKFQPSGTESGWIPLTGQAVGNNWGILSAPNINDQVEVHFYGGEQMVSRVMTRHFSTKNKPPQIDPGEHQFTDQNGSTIYFKKDGTMIIGGASTMQPGQYADGTSGNISTGQQASGETGQPQQQQQNNPPNAKQTITLKPDGTLIIDAPNNNIVLNAHGNQIQKTASKIILTATNLLGSASAINPIAMLGTIDTGGFIDIANLSSTTLTE